MNSCPDPSRCPNRAACDRPIRATQVVPVYGRYGVAASHVAGRIAESSLESEAARGPVQVGVRFHGGRGHMSLIVGVARRLAGPTFFVVDPDKPANHNNGKHEEFSYSQIDTWGGAGVWEHTWNDIH